MSEPVDHVLILRGLDAMMGPIRERLGTGWPAFSQTLAKLLGQLTHVGDQEQEELIARLLALGLASPAAAIFREVWARAMNAVTSEKAPSPTREYVTPDTGVRVGAARRSGRAVLKHTSEHLREELAPRYLNLCLADRRKRSPVPKTTPVAADADYFLRLDIGALSPHSVVENAGGEPFPPLPRSQGGNWLQVAVTSRHFVVPEERFTLFLPDAGPSWTCPCEYGGAHRCLPGQRARHLLIPVRSPAKSGRVEMRLCVYYERNVVQSLVLWAMIAGAPGESEGYGAWIDYSLTARFSELGRFPARDLSIFTNQGSDATHTLIFNGNDDEVIPLYLTEGQMGNAVGAVRDALRRIHIEEWGGALGAEKQRRSRYDEKNRKPRTEFVKDLKELATLGWELWVAVWQERIAYWRENRDRILPRSAKIQVARKHGSKFVFPWSLIYDIPLETGDPEAQRLCPLVADDQNWKAFQSGDGEFPAACPHEESHGPDNVICPFGFWGFRYLIEQPPSMRPGRALPLAIPIDKPPLELLAGFSTDLEPDLLKEHFDKLERTLKLFRVERCGSRKQIESGLAVMDLEVVYLYCHGWRDPLAGTTASSVSIGVGKEERIKPGDLAAWGLRWARGHWQATSPLVFINGCHTVELTPDALVNFVDAFAGLDAAGVIGTEVTLHQRVANEAAETFLEYFQGTKPVGEALRLMRGWLLRKGNLMGLAYTPYCSGSLQLTGSAL